MFDSAPCLAMVKVGEGTQPNGSRVIRHKSPAIPQKNTQLALFVQKYMSNIRQIEANRLNALKSTGPNTPEGKAAVRMNALRHGLRAGAVVLPSENPEEFQRLCDALEAEWQPQSETESFYVEQMAISQWKLIRVDLAEKSIVAQEQAAKIQIPLLDRVWQSQCRMERAYARAQRELERLQKSRRPVDPPKEDDYSDNPVIWIDPEDLENLGPDDPDKPRPRYITWVDTEDSSKCENSGPDDDPIDNNQD